MTQGLQKCLRILKIHKLARSFSVTFLPGISALSVLQPNSGHFSLIFLTLTDKSSGLTWENINNMTNLTTVANNSFILSKKAPLGGIFKENVILLYIRVSVVLS